MGSLLRKPCSSHTSLGLQSGTLSAQGKPAQGTSAGDRQHQENLWWPQLHRSHHTPSPWHSEAPQRRMHASLCAQVELVGEVRHIHSTHIPGEITKAKSGFQFCCLGFFISICSLNLAMCCNALCPKGLSIYAVSVKMLGGWWHTFKPGQAVAANSSYSSIKSLQAHTCCEVNLSPLAVGQHWGRRCRWGVVQGLSKARCASCVLLGKSVPDRRGEELSYSSVWQLLDSTEWCRNDAGFGLGGSTWVKTGSVPANTGTVPTSLIPHIKLDNMLATSLLPLLVADFISFS